MAEIDKTKLQGLYSELKGYLDTLPEPKGYNGPNKIGKRFNEVCDNLTQIARTDFSYLKLDENDHNESGDHNGYGFDGATLKSSIAGLVSRLESDYGFASTEKSTSPAIVINNQNSNSIDIDINFTVDNLIQNANTDEEKEKLQAIKNELDKPNADWGRLQAGLGWILNYSKELSLKVLPIILDYYLKKGGQ